MEIQRAMPMLGFSLKNKICNEVMRQVTKVSEIALKVSRSKWQLVATGCKMQQTGLCGVLWADDEKSLTVTDAIAV